MMGLRTSHGVAAETYAEKTGRTLAEALPDVTDLVAAGYLIFDDDGLRATRSGRQRLNSVLTRLLG